ncbi:hypothetical protein CC80DRAFT_539675 [Byssothecium circinans]|uniref:Rhodopsin domain-containing protein n=1 Tax=Byssothecium circinans TaxID=147558 RepID=A0A6A5TF98_9PLEO|nr:hypothetical protein CC80DRAFT_539675 [Byssothecium circinans]
MFDQVAAGHFWGNKIITANIVLTIITTACLGLRLWAKATTKAKFGWDDYLVILGQLLWFAQVPTQVFASRAGLQMTSFTDPKLLDFIYWVYIAGVFYFPIALCAACSILFFYRRVFPVQETKRLVDIFIVLHVLWGISTTIAEIFMCTPLNIPWTNPSAVPEKCINYPLFFVVAMSLEIVLNTAVLALPIREIMNLKMSMATKLSLGGIFLIGGASIISNIIRTIETYIPGDLFIDFAGDMFWIDIHQATALICANLPVCKPLMRASVTFVSTNFSKTFGSYGSYGSGFSGKKSSGSKGYESFPDATSQRSLVVDEGKDHIHMDHYEKQGNKNSIRVQHTVDIV